MGQRVGAAQERGELAVAVEALVVEFDDRDLPVAAEDLGKSGRERVEAAILLTGLRRCIP